MSDIDFRWMVKSNVPEVLRIEQVCFDTPWTEEDFINSMRQRNCIGMVAERHGVVLSYMLYCLNKDSIHVINFAVSPLCQRDGIGTEMVDKLKTKLSQQRRHTLIVDVRETNLAAQLFWRANGFEWSQTLRGHYDNDEDAYQFRYRSATEQFRPRNRISEFLQGVE